MAAGSDTWTNGNADRQWDEPLNWLGGDIPGDTHTATFASMVDMPNANLPGGITVNYVFTAGITTTISGMVGAASAIGAVTVNHVNTDITAGANITGAITLTNGVLRIAAARTLGGTVAIGSLGGLYLDASGTVVASDTITMSDGSLLENASGTVLDIAATKSLTGTATRISNAGTIQGTVNMTACEWTGDGIITVDEDGTLNLGDDTDNDQDVTVTAAAVTIGDSFRCGSFTLNAVGGTLTGADKTITADDVAWTAGDLDSAGSLNVEMVGTGDLAWAVTATRRLGTVTFSGTTTATGIVVCGKVAGDGTIAGNSHELRIYLGGDNFWTLSTESDGWAEVWIGPKDANQENAVLINIGSSEFVLYYYAHTVTLTGGLTCGTVTINNDAGAATLDMNGGNLTCTGDFKFDENDGTFLAGSGNIVIAGVIELNTGDETGCSIDFETSRVTLGDDVTLAGITPDFGSAYISGAVTIDGTDAGTVANTKAIVVNATVQDLTAPAANPLYVYKDWRREEPEKQVGDNRFPPMPDPALNGLIGTGNTNVEYALVTYGGLWYNRRNRGIRARGRRLTPMGHRRRHLARGRP